MTETAEKTGWQPIETAPLDGTVVLVRFTKNRGRMPCAITASNPTGIQWWSPLVGAVKPTHWMPLPAPPES